MYAWPSGITWATVSSRVSSSGGNSSSAREQVALRWQNGEGGYFGIVNSEGDVGLENNPICELCVLVIVI